MFLLATLAITIIVFVFFIFSFSVLKKNVYLMPKFIKHDGTKDPLIGKRINLLSSHLSAGRYHLVLLTATDCSYCDGTFEQVRVLLRNFNLKFIHIIFDKQTDSMNIKKKSSQKLGVEYLEFKINEATARENRLITFPSYLLIDLDGKVIEVTGLPERIDYYLKNVKKIS